MVDAGCVFYNRVSNKRRDRARIPILIPFIRV